MAQLGVWGNNTTLQANLDTVLPTVALLNPSCNNEGITEALQASAESDNSENKSCQAKAKTLLAPNFTEKEGIEKSLSPTMSGMSFMIAMIVPNTAKKAVAATLSGN